MVHHPDRVEAGVVGGPHDARQRRRRSRRAAGPRERGDLEAELHRRLEGQDCHVGGRRARRATVATGRGRTTPASRRRRSTPRRGVNAAPRTSATGRPDRLPSVSSAAERARRRRRDRRVHHPAVASGVPRRSSSGSRPATPIATSTIPKRHGRPNESRDRRTGDVDAESARAVARGSAAAEASGSSGSSVTIVRVRPDVRGVDAGVGADEAVGRLGDDQAVLHPDDALGARAARPRPGARRGPSARRTRRPRAAARPSSGRRARPRPSRRPSGSRPGRRRRERASRPASPAGPRRSARQVVAGPDLGDALERDDLDPRRLARERRLPARRVGLSHGATRARPRRRAGPRGCRRRRPAATRAPGTARRPPRRLARAPRGCRPPNAGAIDVGGASSSALVRVPWRSPTSATRRGVDPGSRRGRRGARRSPPGHGRQVGREDEDRRGARAPAATDASRLDRLVEARRALDEPDGVAAPGELGGVSRPWSRRSCRRCGRASRVATRVRRSSSVTRSSRSSASRSPPRRDLADSRPRIGTSAQVLEGRRRRQGPPGNRSGRRSARGQPPRTGGKDVRRQPRPRGVVGHDRVGHDGAQPERRDRASSVGVDAYRARRRRRSRCTAGRRPRALASCPSDASIRSAGPLSACPPTIAGDGDDRTPRDRAVCERRPRCPARRGSARRRRTGSTAR